MNRVVTIIFVLGLAACGESASEKMPVDAEIIDTTEIKDGTVVEKTLDVDTPVAEQN